MKSFRDRTVLVTGAAGGIGRLMALAFAERGSDVVVVDVDAQGAEAVAAEVRGKGRRSWAHPLDVTDVEAVQALKAKVETDAGRIDGLVNNAGVVFGGPFEQVPLAKHLATYRVNIEGLVAVTYTFFNDLLQSEDGHLVNIASASGFIGLPNGSTYASSKWAVIGFSESIRLELQQRATTPCAVTTVCPGYIDTGMFSGVKPPLLLPLLSPDRIVLKIMEGVEKNARVVSEPFIVKTLDTLKGLLPRRVFDSGAKLLGVSSSMNSWKGRSD